MTVVAEDTVANAVDVAGTMVVVRIVDVEVVVGVTAHM